MWSGAPGGLGGKAGRTLSCGGCAGNGTWSAGRAQGSRPGSSEKPGCGREPRVTLVLPSSLALRLFETPVEGASEEQVQSQPGPGDTPASVLGGGQGLGQASDGPVSLRS